MKGIQNALNHLDESADQQSLEQMVDAGLALATVGLEEYHQIQKDVSRVMELAAACEALEQSGQFNRAAAVVLMSSLEALGHDFGDVAAMESLDDTALANLGMEGLGDVLRKVGNRLREWWQRRRYATEEQTGNLRKLGEKAAKEIAATRNKLEEVGSERRTFSISSIANPLRLGDGQPDANAVASWVSDLVATTRKTLSVGQQLTKAAESLAQTIDLSSDAAYEKTAVKKFPSIMNLWLKAPPSKGMAEGVSVSIGTLADADKKTILAGDGYKVKGRFGAIVWAREGKKPNKGPEQHATKADALKWLDAAEKFFEELSKGNLIKLFNVAYDEYYNSQVNLYLIEAGEGRETRLVHNLEKRKLRVGDLQALTVPGWSYFEEGVFYSWWSGAAGARALITAARRVAVEGK